MDSKKILGVCFVVLALAVVGCDQVSALFGAKPRVAREVRTVRTPRPTSTPRPLSTSITFPDSTIPPPEPYETAAPAAWVEPTPVPGASPGATTTPWLTGTLVDQGNGLSRLDIHAGGDDRYDRADVWAVHQVDGEVFFFVGYWRVHARAASINWRVDEIRGVGRTFRLVSLVDGGTAIFVPDEKYRPYLDDGALGASSSSDDRRKIVRSAILGLPATPSWDVESLPAYVAATSSARLTDQAEARWGSTWLSLMKLPWYPDTWYPERLDVPPYWGQPFTYEQTREIEVSHGVGTRSAFAFRNYRYRDTGYCSNRDEVQGPMDCGKDSTPLEANEGPLWRLNKGEAEWRPLSVIPWKTPNEEYQEEVRNAWNQVLWSDLHQRWFFWVGAAYGSVYLATEEAATSLK